MVEKGSIYVMGVIYNVVVNGGFELIVWLWDLKIGKCIIKFVGYMDMIRLILISENGDLIMFVSFD